MSKGVLTITDTEFETEVLKSEQPVLVYFWASWCGPCQLMSPQVNSIANTYAEQLKVVKMEVDPNPVAVKQYQVEGVPALRLFKGENVLVSSEGALTKDKIVNLIEPYLS